MFTTLHQSEGGPAAQTLPPCRHTHDGSLHRELREYVEIERIGCRLPSRVWRRRQQEVRA